MGKTGRLNLEMNDWMGNQNKKREKLTDSDILKQFEQAEKDTRFLPINPQRFPIQRTPNHPVKPAGAL